MRDYMTDGHISLRKYRIGDELALYEGINESIQELSRWGFYHVGFTLQDAAQDVASRIARWIEGRTYNFVVQELPNSVFVGVCKVEEIEPERHRAALGWWVRTGRTREGIATAAARLLAQAAFEDLHLASLRVYANVNNRASRRVAEKIGALLVQIRPEEDGNYCAVYELKPEDLQAA